MDCMESFSIRINQSTVFNDLNGAVKTWGTAGAYNWSSYNTPLNAFSTYNLQGFKRINIYGISINGYVQGEDGTFNNATVLDWGFKLTINGTASLVSGDVSTGSNGWAIQQTGNNVVQFLLSKYTPTLMLGSPIQGVSSVVFNTLFASGTAATLLDTVYLIYDLYFTFYYKYEGDD